VISLGVDIGSLSGKAVVLVDGEVRAWHVIPTGPDSVQTGTEVTRLTLEKAGLVLEQVDRVVSTGYGRIVIPFANRNVSEISCHAKGAAHLHAGARTILDMGGQDCKAIRCDGSGKVLAFVMNDKCAAGAGRSMGIMAELTGVPLAELGPLSLEAEGEGVPVSSVCVVFARSEVLAFMRDGVPRSEVLAGACEALVKRVHGLLRRVGVEEDFVISGGIAKNVGVVKRLEERLGVKAHVGFEPQIVGALGAALFAAELAARPSRKADRRERRRRRQAEGQTEG
jgi:predicted CoA-substrate-specific enzyme activase